MADAVNAIQRNLYPRADGTRFTREYRDGRGVDYNESLRGLSWSINTDVTPIGQKSSSTHLPEIADVFQFKHGTHFLHPTVYGKLRHTDHLSFSKSMGNLGLGTHADPSARAAPLPSQKLARRPRARGTRLLAAGPRS